MGSTLGFREGIRRLGYIRITRIGFHLRIVIELEISSETKAPGATGGTVGMGEDKVDVAEDS